MGLFDKKKRADASAEAGATQIDKDIQNKMAANAARRNATKIIGELTYKYCK